MNDDERTCPECAETIKKGAAVCKHCGHRFRSADHADGPRTTGEKKVAKYSRIGCVVVVIGLIALIATCDLPENETSSNNAVEAGDADAADQPLDSAGQALLVQMGRDAVKARLKDPDSADFRNVGYYSGGETEGAAVCGEVNSRNSFGGYTGFERFVAAGNAAFFESDTNDGRFGPDVWDRLCVKGDGDEPNIP